jgi:2-keto-4-pentenoate hydratase
MPLDEDAVVRAVDTLMAARANRMRIETLPVDCRPADTDTAYRIQAAYGERLLAAAGGGDIVGYKIGCTNPTAQAQLGLDAPFRGLLLSSFVRRAPADIPAADGFMRMIEPEIAFRMGRDLPARGAPYDAESVRDAVATAMPAIEVVDSRYVDWTTAGAPHLIADNACTGFWVHGDEIADLSGFDFADHPSRLIRNGVPAETGNSANVMGHPFVVLAWLANHLAEWGLPLRAGHLVTTGTTTAVNPAEKGDEVTADFGDLGQVTVRFT